MLLIIDMREKDCNQTAISTLHYCFECVVVKSEFNTSVSNENYESLIDHLRTHISNAVRRQFELNGINYC